MEAYAAYLCCKDTQRTQPYWLAKRVGRVFHYSDALQENHTVVWEIVHMQRAVVSEIKHPIESHFILNQLLKVLL